MEFLIIIVIITLVFGYIVDVRTKLDTISNIVLNIDVPEDIISIKESIDLLSLPIITFENNNRKLNFIIDTGANITVINSILTDYLSFISFGDDQISTVANGTDVNTKNATIEYKYKDNIFVDEVALMDMTIAFGNIKQEYGIKIHGLLGSNFLSKYGYIIDFDKQIIYNKK